MCSSINHLHPPPPQKKLMSTSMLCYCFKALTAPLNLNMTPSDSCDIKVYYKLKKEKKEKKKATT